MRLLGHTYVSCTTTQCTTISTVFSSPVCFEVILFTQFFFAGFHCGKQWIHTELLASATCALNCRSEWKASPFRLTKLRAACKWWPVCIPCGLKSKLKYVQMVGKLVIDIFGSRLQTMANSPCAFIFPPSVFRFVVIVHLLHGVVIHASKLLFWVVEIFNFSFKTRACCSSRLFFSLRLTHSTIYFTELIYKRRRRKKRKRNEMIYVWIKT